MLLHEGMLEFNSLKLLFVRLAPWAEQTPAGYSELLEKVDTFFPGWAGKHSEMTWASIYLGRLMDVGRGLS